ncbi:hypothetical protein FB45DRAFT_301677 [Roridomyces roridus]|uniref:Uncharacterized protein n=1 Tax=Roridomyces roridus TaxID=1738132 RepID=A0AAD7B6W9_9AGAR|nr:hypothetical protein FB45DRAFT_301677 [Roridomyces roridus]
MVTFDGTRRASTDSSSSDSTTIDTEGEWKSQNLPRFEKLKRKFDRANEGDKKSERAARYAEKLVDLMKEFARTHPNAAERAKWEKRADDFKTSRAGGSDGGKILMDIAMGVGIIVAAPFAVAGAVLYGVGRLLTGIGNGLTGGQAGKTFE